MGGYKKLFVGNGLVNMFAQQQPQMQQYKICVSYVVRAKML
jgi:hypothetical protein